MSAVLQIFKKFITFDRKYVKENKNMKIKKLVWVA